MRAGERRERLGVSRYLQSGMEFKRRASGLEVWMRLAPGRLIRGPTTRGAARESTTGGGDGVHDGIAVEREEKLSHGAAIRSAVTAEQQHMQVAVHCAVRL